MQGIEESKATVTAIAYSSQMTAKQPAAAPTDFGTDLLDACSDGGVCFKGFFCPCLLVGEIHEKMGQTYSTFCCLHLFCNGLGLACARRGMLRFAYNFQPSPCGDCLAVTCCSPCATIQEYHQLSKTTYPIHPEINQWGTGMFDCQEDGYMCTKGAICPCMVSADALAEMGAPWFCLCMCPIGCAARTLIRETYNIPGSFFKDFLTCILCCPCATCQEARFMKAVNLEFPAPAVTPASPPVTANRM